MQHRQFRNFLDENEAILSELPKLHSVRWLSCEMVFNAFFKIVDLIKEFIENKFGPEMFPELSDEIWLQKLAFFSDLTTLLGSLNRSLQGEMNTVWNSYTKIAEFKMKLESLKSDFEAGNIETFTNLHSIKLCGGNISTSIFVNWISQLKTDFDLRFKDFESLIPLMRFAKSPDKTEADDVTAISELLNLSRQSFMQELNEYRSEILLVKDTSFEILKRFSLLKLVYAKALSLFSSSYACESAFSKLNFIYNQYRSSLTQQNIENCLLISTSKIDLDLEDIVVNRNCRISTD